jgi:ubiquinone/menaquinone biosynthesis C-methylase UbiE
VKDRFSSHSKQYATFRPTYPKALYEFILAYVKGRELAWDCGCGNGQVALDLSKFFKQVKATDLSAKQIESAVPSPNIEYAVSPAEHTTFSDSSFDLITVGQALHWFDIPQFNKEVQRVAKPNGVIAVWGYGLLQIDSVIDQYVKHFYTEVIGPYWDNERKLVDEEYATLPFPFKEVSTPSFVIEDQWSIKQFEGYINTWSSVVKFKKQNEINPVDDLIKHIFPVWGDKQRTIQFPLFLRLGIVEK